MQLIVTGGPHPVANLPVSAAIEKQEGGLKLTSAGKPVLSQVEQKDGKTVVYWIIDKLGAGEQRAYDVALEAAETTSEVRISKMEDERLEVSIGGKVFTRYHYGSQWPRPFLFPFVGPDDAHLTRAYPMLRDVPGETKDHKHHRSVWVAYGEVNGTDNWTEEEGHATQKDTGHEFVSGPVFGRITETCDWLSNTGVKQMEDHRTFTFYNLPDSERVVDVEVVLKATVGDVALTDTKEGGLISVRVATSMDGDKGGMISNAYGGRTEKECWGKPAQWVDYYGPVGGKTVGIAIFDHPDSFRYPTRWHVRDYGLFTANPFALKYYEPERGWNGDHTMKKGESLTFRYRLYAHRGDTQSAGVSDRFLTFIHPPKIEVK
jgi:hypothetical protein